MASRWYGIDRGASQEAIVEQSSSPGKDLEVQVDLAVSLQRNEVLLALDYIQRKIFESSFPPSLPVTDHYGYGLNRGGVMKDIVAEIPVRATGTITAASVLEGDTATVQGAVLTAQDLREKFTVLCVADSAGSLNNKYFTLSTPTTDYYVWFNVNSAGTDPALAGKTAIPVALATNASNSTVASAVNTAVGALSSAFTSSVSTATVTIICVATGAVTNAANGTASPGFTITTTREGAATPGTDKFSMNGTDTAVALSLVAAINANATSAAVVTADSALGVVTVHSILGGTVGNAYTLATSNSGRLAKSGTTLASGAQSASGKAVRVEVEMTASWKRNEVLDGIDKIKNYILADTFPPA